MSEDISAVVREIHAQSLSDLHTTSETAFLKSWRKALHQVQRTQVTTVRESLTAETIDGVAIAAEVERELGISIDTLQEVQKKAVQLYVYTVLTRAAADQKLANVLERLEGIQASIQNLILLEPTPALNNLTEPVRIYLESVVTQLGVGDAHRASVEQAARLEILRSVLRIGSFASEDTEGPICSICMTQRISFALTPCGHAYCQECCDKQKTACYTCRDQIRDRLRIYFG